MHGRKLDRRISVFDTNRKLVVDTLVEKRLRCCLFFYLILNRTLMLNSVKYEVVCFCSILFLLNIKK